MTLRLVLMAGAGMPRRLPQGGRAIAGGRRCCKCAALKRFLDQPSSDLRWNVDLTAENRD